MNVSAWSIKNPIPAVMLFVMLTFAGILAFKSMKVQQFPDLELPTVAVSASLPGAAPAQLETEVARKLENAIAPLQGLKNIYTKVQDGGVLVTAEFRLEKPTQEAVDDVRSAMQSVRSELPSDVRDPVVSKINLSGAPILAFTVRAPSMDDEALSWFVDNTVARRLLGVKGVGSVARVGGVNRQVEVALDPMKLQSLGATAAEISRQLKQVQTESAGGRADLAGSEQPMRTLATVKTAEELASLELALNNGQRIRLDEVATVKDTVESESDLVGSFHTEYGAFKWGLFFVAEYSHMIVGSGVFMLLFGGGWNPLPWVSLATAVDWLGAILPFAHAPLFVGVLSIAIFLGKTLAMIFLFMWVRWTLPRFRYDQVMKIGWQKMLPLSIANLLFYAIAIAVLQK